MILLELLQTTHKNRLYLKCCGDENEEKKTAVMILRKCHVHVFQIVQHNMKSLYSSYCNLISTTG